jgi:hypothetical protein
MVQEGYEARKRKDVAQTFTARRNRNGLLDTWGGAFWALWALSTWSMFGMRAYV